MINIDLKINKDDFRSKLGIVEPIIDTPDMVVDKINMSSLFIDKSKIEGLAELERLSKINQMPITTSFVNGKRAKNINFTDANISYSGDTANISPSGTLTVNYTAVSTTHTITETDYLINCTSGTFTVTLPTAVGITGREYVIKNSGTGTITVATTSSQTIDDDLTGMLNQYDSITVVSTGSNWIII